ncbi:MULTISPECIES: Dabb family protein [Oceanibaculum]|uniref:Quinol monooxygenase YgiN n=1 Tax=Oceanibaculum indicum TaxID=526216 RepID=A0A420WN55_9PROT|nr:MULTISPECIES: Dabb family protein [Oceanibaculum]MCH2393814.1 Dabb family protein [Oceanibaculum sp.]RKQ72478.1 quinol monooxygenase YgiN [Oceanibaculum indicum]
MIRHIVFFSVKDPAQLDEVEEGLKLLTQSPYPSLLEVKRNLRRDLFGNEVDLVVYGEFPNQATLDRYKEDPLYQRSIDRVRPLRELRIAADIEG